MGGLICTCVLTAFTIHPADITARLGVDLQVLLTVVAFMLVVSSMVPPVSYVTLLQEYVLGSFIFVMAQTLLHGFLPHVYCKMADNSPLTLPPLNSDCEVDTLKLSNVIGFISAGIWI